MHRNKWVQIQFFFLLQWANLIGPLQKKIEIMETPQNTWFYGNMECPPLAHLYRWKREDFGQNIWD
jgi:hypothetical protein